MTRATKPRAKRTLEDMRTLNDAAKAILNDPAFLHAREELQERLVNALIASKTTEETQDLVARLKCLMQIAAEIAVLMNDYRVAAERAGRPRPS